MAIRWKRTIRTPASERFVAIRDSREVATVDLHFMADGTVHGTVMLFTETADDEEGKAPGEPIAWREEEVPDLLASLDDELLPTVDVSAGDLVYTVFVGKLMGSYEIEETRE